LLESSTILEIFARNDIAGKLLILGEPGSGKTITLLELAQGLVQNAEANLDNPLPVLFNLSFWKDPRQLIPDWLVEQLNSYGIPKRFGKAWVDNCQILPLLDGLDEMKPELQISCVQAINQWLQKEYRLRLVVCSRKEEYEKVVRGHWKDDKQMEEETAKSAEETRLHLNGAILLQSLTNDQIQEYLVTINQPELWQTIKEDSELLGLIRAPLFLSILGFIAFHHQLSIQYWQTLSSTEARLQYLFNAYWEAATERELVSSQRRAKGIRSVSYDKRIPPNKERTQNWLTFLAKQLSQKSQTEFLIERIQFDWASESMMMKVKLIQLFFMLFSLLGYFWSLVKRDFLQNYPVSLLEITLMVLAVASMLISVPFSEVFDFTRELHLVRNLHWSWRKALRNFIEPLIYGSAFGVSVGLIAGLSSQLKLGELGGAMLGFSVGCLIAKVFFSEVFKGLSDILEIVLIELLKRAFAIIRQTLNLNEDLSITVSNLTKKFIRLTLTLVAWLLELTGAFFVGFIFAMAGFWGSTNNAGFINNLRDGLINGILLGFTTGFIRICTTGWEEVKEIEPSFPNKGIKTSLQQFLIVSTTFLLVFIAFGVVITCFAQSFFFRQQSNGTYYIFSVGLGLLFGLMIRWQEAPIENATIFVRHSILRLILWLDGSIPWNYARFLDYCTERLFLQQVGGRYRFIHKSVQEHFARMGE
jgi:DNA polymerase III delta prime subunit